MNIKIELETSIQNGMELTFRAPEPALNITGLKVYYKDGQTYSSKEFLFADAHGMNIGGKDLFAAGAVVKVILDTVNSQAFVQNSDTNVYLEGKFQKCLTLDTINASGTSTTKLYLNGQELDSNQKAQIKSDLGISESTGGNGGSNVLVGNYNDTDEMPEGCDLLIALDGNAPTLNEIIEGIRTSAIGDIEDALAEIISIQEEKIGDDVV